MSVALKLHLTASALKPYRAPGCWAWFPLYFLRSLLRYLGLGDLLGVAYSPIVASWESVGQR